MYTPKKKIVKWYCVFNDRWLEEEHFRETLRKDSAEMAKCVLCNITFMVKHNDICAI
jgi:hypothetical protein